MELYKNRSSSDDKCEKVFVSLEEIALEEDMLSLILEVSYNPKQDLWGSRDPRKETKDWWEITVWNSVSKIEVTHLIIPQSLFVNDKLRKTICQTKMLEIISIGFISVKAPEILQNVSLLGSTKNLIYYVHQNFLILIEYILSRIPSSIESVLFLVTIDLGIRTSQYYKTKAW